MINALGIGDYVKTTTMTTELGKKVDKVEGSRLMTNARQQLTRILLPLMMPSVTECLFLSLLNSFKVYDVNLALTGGGPYRSSEAITMNVYTTAFSENQLGYGSAKAVIMALIIIGITLLQVAITSRKEVRS